MLLNADTLAVQIASVSDQAQAHDLLVRMVNDTVAVGMQTQTVQRVQVVDQTSGGAILAVGDLSEIRAVAIGVTSGADTITLDLNSFGSVAAPKLTVRGDGLTALAIDSGAGGVAFQIDGSGAGGATGGGANVSFTGIASVAAASALPSSPVSSIAPDAGVAPANGSAGAPAVAIGSQQAAPAADTVTFTGQYAAIDTVLTGSDLGSVALDGDSIAFAGYNRLFRRKRRRVRMR